MVLIRVVASILKKSCPFVNRKYLVEGEGGGVEVMLIGPDWEGGDPSMMSSESTVEGEAGVMKDWIYSSK